MALQLGVSSPTLDQYGDRIHTRTDHLREIQACVDFRDPQASNFDALVSWLAERAMEHDRPLALLHLSCVFRVRNTADQVTSLKMGWATASLLVGKLQSHRGIGIQLNRGESLHDLRRFLFFANEGEIRRAQHEDQTVQALCLNLVTNAVITWNTVHMTKALDVLRADSIPVSDEDLAHLAPTLRAHVNPYGKYTFEVDSGLARTGLRPLREPSAAASA